MLLPSPQISKLVVQTKTAIAIPSVTQFAHYSQQQRHVSVAVPNSVASSTVSSSTSSPLIDFNNTKELYRTRSITNLVSSYVTLKSCQLSLLARWGPTLLEAGGPVSALGAKLTYFRYFCGGESLEDASIQEAINYCAKDGMKVILDYSVEGANSDKRADEINQVILNSIYFSEKENAKAGAERLSFGVVKMTGIIDCKVLEKLSEIICYEQVHQVEKSMLPNSLHIESYHNKMNFRTPAFSFANKKPTPLNDDELAQLDRTLQRLDKLCQASKTTGVPLLVDAEHSYYQPAIDQMFMLMCLRYNEQGKHPVVYNTYQMYLKDAFQRLQYDREFAKARGIDLGCKLVRGAYMKLENERSRGFSLPSPINPSIEATHTSYNNGVQYALQNIHQMAVVIATHNQNTVVQSADWIVNRYGIPRENRRVQFAQLYGMGDSLSLALSLSGFNISKYVPFGPLNEVLPYLSRRLIENSDVMGGATNDIQRTEKEIKRRMFIR